MLFSGFQKLTLLDFPGKTAATAFSPGCNFRCPFCHNARLVVPGEGETEHVGEEEILAYMAKRRGLLDGLCLTGGEPTLQADLPDFCRKVKELGLLVKLDTNGFRPDAVRRLIDEKLVDYVAMDVKNSRERYAETAGLPEIDLWPVEESIALLKEGRVDYEFRTTVVSQLHDRESLLSLARWLTGAKAWYLQQFVDSGGCIRQGLTAWPEDALRAFEGELQQIMPTVHLRGI